MPRRSRKRSLSGFYHVIIRGINQEDIFETNRDKEKIIKYMKDKKEDYVEIFAFCIMKNHLHLLLRGDLKQISLFMKMIETSYALYYNRKRKRSGYVFQNRFKSFPIEDKEYLWHCWHYIHLNPVKAKIVQTPEQYYYSSAREYRLGREGLVNLTAFEEYQKDKIYYPVSKLTHNLEQSMVYIDDLDDEKEKQKQQIMKRWVKSYLKNHPESNIWELKNLPVEKEKLIEEVWDMNIMSRKEFVRRLEQF